MPVMLKIGESDWGQIPMDLRCHWAQAGQVLRTRAQQDLMEIHRVR